MGGRRARAGGRRWLWTLTVLAATACGDDIVGVDADLAALVGDWKATELVVTSVANPSVSPDLIAMGASFKINIQPSGQYTAILIYAQQTSTEIGTIIVSGNTVTLERSFPASGSATATYRLTGSTLVLDGDTEFDFNLDGTPEAAVSHIVLERQ